MFIRSGFDENAPGMLFSKPNNLNLKGFKLLSVNFKIPETSWEEISRRQYEENACRQITEADVFNSLETNNLLKLSNSDSGSTVFSRRAYL